MARNITRYLTIFVLLLSVAGTAHALNSAAGDDTFIYRLTLFLHQVLFVFWLGPDIGVYMWSTKAVNAELSPAQRISAGRMMQMIELIPRACMSLMLTVGGILTEMMGIEHPWWQMAGIVLLGPVWLTLTILVYARSGTEQGVKLGRLDELFRWVVIAGVIASAGFSVITERLADTPWVTAKLLIFAAVVFFGLMMRKRLVPFTEALANLESDGPSPGIDQAMTASISRTRIYMFAAWIALAMAAALGMVQPGSAEEPSVAASAEHDPR
jgi:putative copper export protein